MKKINLKGRRYGRLIVLDDEKSTSYGKTQSLCLCDCGKIFVALNLNIVAGKTKSCGCLKISLLIKKLTTHGQSQTRLYMIWQTMKKRCLNIKRRDYKYYGGRGIRICDEWLNNFKSFFEWAVTHGYNDNLTIDRINNDGNYEPSNCRFVTMAVQNMNKGYETK